MREILFRGKRIDNGEWIEGDLIHRQVWRSYLAIIRVRDDGFDNYTEYEVYPSTVGQYTGKTDKYNAIIFEDDIIRANHDGAVGVIRFGEYMSPSDPGNTRHTGYYVDWQGKEKDFLRADLGYWANRRDVEVIGNIHDNPELLEDKP